MVLARKAVAQEDVFSFEVAKEIPQECSSIEACCKRVLIGVYDRVNNTGHVCPLIRSDDDQEKQFKAKPKNFLPGFGADGIVQMV